MKIRKEYEKSREPFLDMLKAFQSVRYEHLEAINNVSEGTDMIYLYIQPIHSAT